MPFILDGLDSEDYDRSYKDRELLRRIVGYFRPYRRQVILASVMLTLNSTAGTAGPILISNALDLVKKDPSLHVLLLLSLGVLLLGVFAWGFNYIRQVFSARVVGDVVLQLAGRRVRLRRAQRPSFFDQHPSGKIVSRVTSDTQDFSDVVTLVLDVISQLLLVVLLAVWLFSINVRLTLLILAMSPVAFVIALSFRRIARKVTRNAKRVTAVINSEIQESISGIVVAKSFRQEQAIFDRFLGEQSTGLPGGLGSGPDHEQHLPDPRHRLWTGHRAARVCRRSGYPHWDFTPGRLVPVHAGGDLFLVAPDQHRIFLEPVPGRTVCRRAGLRSDRHRPKGRPDRV